MSSTKILGGARIYYIYVPYFLGICAFYRTCYAIWEFLRKCNIGPFSCGQSHILQGGASQFSRGGGVGKSIPGAPLVPLK